MRNGKFWRKWKLFRIHQNVDNVIFNTFQVTLASVNCAKFADLRYGLFILGEGLAQARSSRSITTRNASAAASRDIVLTSSNDLRATRKRAAPPLPLRGSNIDFFAFGCRCRYTRIPRPRASSNTTVHPQLIGVQACRLGR